MIVGLFAGSGRCLAVHYQARVELQCFDRIVFEKLFAELEQLVAGRPFEIEASKVDFVSFGAKMVKQVN